MAQFLHTHDIFSVLNEMIGKARKFILIVSPYIILDGEQAILLKKAAEKGVPITIIYRLDDERTATRLEELSGLNGIRILGCPELHAKIYATEKAAIMASKNLTTRQMDCSIEIGILYNRGDVFYRDLLQTGEDIVSLSEQNALVDNTKDETIENSEGYCIRCRTPIPLDIKHPLCQRCFDIWNQFKDADYPECYCHYCGSNSSNRFFVSFRYPMEPDCFSRWCRA